MAKVKLDKKMLAHIGAEVLLAVAVCLCVAKCESQKTRDESQEAIQNLSNKIDNNYAETNKKHDEEREMINNVMDKVLDVRNEGLDSLAAVRDKLRQLDSVQKAHKSCLCGPKKDNARPARPVKAQPAKPVKTVAPATPAKSTVVVAAQDTVVVPSSGNMIVNSGAAQSQINGNTEVNFENGINNGTVIINNGGVINQTGANQQNGVKEKDPWEPAVFLKTSVREYVYHRKRCK